MKERNRPSPEGIAFGEQLARFADVEEARFRAAGLAVPVRCQSCAYRKGSYPNQCLSTVANAMKCSMEREPFYCHHGMKLKQDTDQQRPKSVCGGWILMHSAEPPVEAPWPFT